MESLEMFRSKSLAAARAAFIEAAWNDAAPAELVKLAEAASLSLSLADSIREEIEALKASLPAATEHPRRAKAFERARSAFETRKKETEAQISALEDGLDQAGCALNEMGAAVEEAEHAVVFLSTSDLIPASVKVPGAVADYRARHAGQFPSPPRPWQKTE